MLASPGLFVPSWGNAPVTFAQIARNRGGPESGDDAGPDDAGAGRGGDAVPALTFEPFRRRVEQLRTAWAERRALRGIAGAHDRASQPELLRTLHAWASEAAAEIRAVYGPSLAVQVSPLPAGDEATAFTVNLARDYTLAFALVERSRTPAERWHIAVTMTTGGPRGASVAAGPERRNGQWTRARVEDLLLSLLGAYERDRSGDAGPPTRRGR